jgi:hypothetical protein
VTEAAVERLDLEHAERVGGLCVLHAGRVDVEQRVFLFLRPGAGMT